MEIEQNEKKREKRQYEEKIRMKGWKGEIFNEWGRSDVYSEGGL